MLRILSSRRFPCAIGKEWISQSSLRGLRPVIMWTAIEDTQDGSVVVFYAVSDRAGNVAKTSRVFEAVFDDQSAGRYMEAGIDAALQMEHMTIDYERGKDGQDEGETEIMPSPSPLSSITPSPLSEPALDPTSTPALDPTSAATPLRRDLC